MNVANVIESWVLGILSALIALGGLFLASKTHEGFMEVVGIFIFAFGVFFIFQLIKGQSELTD